MNYTKNEEHTHRSTHGNFFSLDGLETEHTTPHDNVLRAHKKKPI